MPGPRERAATKQLVNRRKRRNIGLQCRRKYERTGGKYKYQRILMESGKTKSVHMLSGRSSYTRLAYSRSKLLDDDCLVAEVVVEPSIFVESRELPQDIAEVRGEQASEEDNASTTSTTSTITESTMGTMQTRSQSSQGSQSTRRSHAEILQLKSAIAYQFKFVLSLPSKQKWHGKEGTITDIAEKLNLGRGQNKVITRVLEDVMKCEEVGTVYSPVRQYSPWSDEKHLLPMNSREVQIIGDAMEDGHSLRTTTKLVNEHR